jgi:hypothetical protein
MAGTSRRVFPINLIPAHLHLCSADREHASSLMRPIPIQNGHLELKAGAVFPQIPAESVEKVINEMALAAGLGVPGA